MVGYVAPFYFAVVGYSVVTPHVYVDYPLPALRYAVVTRWTVEYHPHVPVVGWLTLNVRLVATGFTPVESHLVAIVGCWLLPFTVGWLDLLWLRCYGCYLYGCGYIVDGVTLRSR